LGGESHACVSDDPQSGDGSALSDSLSQLIRCHAGALSGDVLDDRILRPVVAMAGFGEFQQWLAQCPKCLRLCARVLRRGRDIAFDLIEQRPHRAITSRDQYLGAPGKSFCQADMAVGAHDYDRLVLAVQAEPPCAQCRLNESALVGRHHSSNACDWRGTTAAHPNAWSMRERSASDACASPCTMKTRLGGR